jgi:hypothetical protein
VLLVGHDQVVAHAGSDGKCFCEPDLLTVLLAVFDNLGRNRVQLRHGFILRRRRRWRGSRRIEALVDDLIRRVAIGSGLAENFGIQFRLGRIERLRGGACFPKVDSGRVPALEVHDLTFQ